MPGSVRVGAAWLLALLFLVFARPAPTLLVVGGCTAAVGLLVRAWAAGSLDKGRALTTEGPYAHTRNPLYLGSFVIGVGISLAGGHWAWPVLFAVFFVVVYVPTMRQEAAELLARFGEPYRTYAASVPAFAIRLRPYRTVRHPVEVEAGPTEPEGSGFEWRRYMRYREWEAALGVAGMLGVLVLKLWAAG